MIRPRPDRSFCLELQAKPSEPPCRQGATSSPISGISNASTITARSLNLLLLLLVILFGSSSPSSARLLFPQRPVQCEFSSLPPRSPLAGGCSSNASAAELMQ